MRKLKLRIPILWIALLAGAWGVPAGSFAASSADPNGGVTLASAREIPARGRRSVGRGRVIDFEDSLVEGVNKRPLDSLSQIGDADRRKRPHLYRKRAGFRTETLETVREIRMAQ